MPKLTNETLKLPSKSKVSSNKIIVMLMLVPYDLRNVMMRKALLLIEQYT